MGLSSSRQGLSSGVLIEDIWRKSPRLSVRKVRAALRLQHWCMITTDDMMMNDLLLWDLLLYEILSLFLIEPDFLSKNSLALVWYICSNVSPMLYFIPIKNICRGSQSMISLWEQHCPPPSLQVWKREIYSHWGINVENMMNGNSYLNPE